MVGTPCFISRPCVLVHFLVDVFSSGGYFLPILVIFGMGRFSTACHQIEVASSRATSFLFFNDADMQPSVKGYKIPAMFLFQQRRRISSFCHFICGSLVVIFQITVTL